MTSFPAGRIPRIPGDTDPVHQSKFQGRLEICRRREPARLDKAVGTPQPDSGTRSPNQTTECPGTRSSSLNEQCRRSSSGNGDRKLVTRVEAKPRSWNGSAEQAVSQDPETGQGLKNLPRCGQHWRGQRRRGDAWTHDPGGCSRASPGVLQRRSRGPQPPQLPLVPSPPTSGLPGPPRPVSPLSPLRSAPTARKSEAPWSFSNSAPRSPDPPPGALTSSRKPSMDDTALPLETQHWSTHPFEAVPAWKASPSGCTLEAYSSCRQILSSASLARILLFVCGFVTHGSRHQIEQMTRVPVPEPTADTPHPPVKDLSSLENSEVTNPTERKRKRDCKIDQKEMPSVLRKCTIDKATTSASALKC
ncbi:PREDICTED: uncharacterized protein LOC106149178 [Chinchilla lanigera]|uniref:uncharacterized protein LOC106149178 n=1 Tax=Chinchilla lanigera TaxID=34839 RepID=UPI0006979E74|nr:PREDICTED: uncharacterized protein LOC106149178 [Chinchilla lanigera]